MRQEGRCGSKQGTGGGRRGTKGQQGSKRSGEGSKGPRCGCTGARGAARDHEGLSGAMVRGKVGQRGIAAMQGSSEDGAGRAHAILPENSVVWARGIPSEDSMGRGCAILLDDSTG